MSSGDVHGGVFVSMSSDMKQENQIVTWVSGYFVYNSN